MNKLLPLKYKGSRNYLHGSDVFNALSAIGAELTGEAGCFVDRLIFRRNARKVCEVAADKPVVLEQLIGQVRYQHPTSSERFHYYLQETEVSVAGRYEYDEPRIEAATTVDKEARSAELSEPSGFTAIEEVIAVTKCLNYAVSPLTEGNWLFGQLTLVEPLPESFAILKVQMKSLFDAKFSLSELIVDGRNIGTIKFIAGVV